MIKRRFYKIDHGGRDASDASSSSSDEDHDDAIAEDDEDEVHSISSGYKSEDSSANDVDDVNSAGLLFSEDDVGTVNEEPMLINKELPSECDSEKSNVLDEKKPLVLPRETQFYVLKFKSVFKCRICPRVICLTEDTLRVHLQSKRHARSEKLHKEGRLKAMLNSDGEIEIQSEDSEDDTEKNDKGLTQQKKKFRKNVKKTSMNQDVSEVQSEDSEDNTAKNDEGLKQHKKKFRKKVKKTSMNQDVSEIQSEDSKDNTEKNEEGLKQHKKKFRKKKSDNANKRKKRSTKGPDKRRRKK